MAKSHNPRFPIQRSYCCQSWTIRIAKTPKQANESAIRIFERFLVEKGWVKKDSVVKADSDAAAAGKAESERSLLRCSSGFSLYSIVNILPRPICII